MSVLSAVIIPDLDGGYVSQNPETGTISQGETIDTPGILKLEFNCGTNHEVDLNPIMFGSLFGELKNPNFFKQVSLDSEVGTVCWPNSADFDPDTLFRWNEHVHSLSSHLQSA